jgi:predicted DNA-binding protein (MmcQ/YjbR family)
MPKTPGAPRRRSSSPAQTPRERLRAAALTYPGAAEEFPWGEAVVKVDGKIFVFLPGDEPGSLRRLTLKLPSSAGAALALPGAEVTGYGLGRSGWVTLPLEEGLPFELALEWLEESYRAVATKRRQRELDEREPAPPGARRRESQPRRPTKRA